MTHEQVIEDEIGRMHEEAVRAHDVLETANVERAEFSLPGRVALLAVRAATLEAAVRKIAHLDPAGDVVDGVTEIWHRGEFVGTGPLEAVELIENAKSIAQGALEAIGRGLVVPVVMVLPHPSDAEPGAA